MQTENENAREQFYAHCKAIGERAISLENPVIAHHYDADGLSSGAIVCRAFRLLQKPYEEITFRQLDEKALERLASSGRNIIVVDFGSGQTQKVLEKIPAEKLVIIDHHVLDTPKEERAKLGLSEANCELFGLSGATEACAASTAYFCFKHLSDWLINELAVVGIVGDMQDKDVLSPSNQKVVDEGVATGFVKVEKDLRAFGRVSRTLVSFISFCTEPYLPGLTGNDKACALFINDLGIPLFEDAKGTTDWQTTEHDGTGTEQVKRRWLHYYDLDFESRQKLASALINYAYSHKVKPHAIKAMVGNVYLFPKEEKNIEIYDAYEFSTVLNACGRHKAESLGMSVCLHEKGALEQARSLVTLHRTQIRSGLLYARRHVSDFGAFYFLDGRGEVEDSVVGIVCGSFLSSGVVDPVKPILGFSLDPSGNIKISARGTDELVKKGLDLNVMLRKATEGIGVGGGHNVAAGATLFADESGENAKRFLLKAKEIIQGQLPR
jgi:single-stranded-DNA-specific exonuclease